MNGKMKFIGGVDFDELRAQRVKVYDTFTIDLATARADQELVISGNYIYALEATDIDTILQVKLNEIPRSLITLYKGRGVRAPFYRLYLTNTAQAGKTLTIAVGIESDTFEVFDVGKALEISGSIYDNSWFKDTYDGEAMIGCGYRAGSAAVYSSVQLWNPATTGVNLYLKKLYGYIESAGLVEIRHNNAAHTGTAGVYEANKFIGGAAPVAEIRWQDNGPGTRMVVMASEGVTPYKYENDFWPAIIIPPGQGVSANPITVDKDNRCNFEWAEIAV